MENKRPKWEQLLPKLESLPALNVVRVAIFGTHVVCVADNGNGEELIDLPDDTAAAFVAANIRFIRRSAGTAYSVAYKNSPNDPFTAA